MVKAILLKDPFSAGHSVRGCRLSCGCGEPQAGGGELLTPVRASGTQELMTADFAAVRL